MERLESAYASVGVYILSRCALREAWVETVHPGTFPVNGFSCSRDFNFGIYTYYVGSRPSPQQQLAFHLRDYLFANVTQSTGER